jgi:hypothetical protein
MKGNFTSTQQLSSTKDNLAFHNLQFSSTTGNFTSHEQQLSSMKGKFGWNAIVRAQ